MRFEEAIWYALRGQRVHRHAWGFQFRAWLRVIHIGNRILLFRQTPEPSSVQWRPSANDRRARDWFLLQETSLDFRRFPTR